MRLEFASVPFVLFATTLVAQDQPPGYAEALARYKECSTRIPFQHHTEGRRRLAETRALAGLPLLAEDYVKAKTFPENAKYTIAALLGKNFARAECVDQLRALREANDKPVDMWLWVHCLRIEADNVGDTTVAAIARDSKNALHRAAAILAIGESKSANLKTVIVPVCVDFPKKESDRMALLGAMSGALWENRSRVNSEEYRDALTAYIGLLGDDVGLSHTAKVQMARHLQWILKGPALFVNPEPWLDLMKQGDVKTAKPGGGHTAVAQRFFGVETEGERFCYVVDMSDSMCRPIAPSAKPPKVGPTTGAGAKAPVKKKRELLDEGDLPWDKINTRWDLAREHLRISLMRLPADKHFAIVLFGTDSETPKSCRGMIKATKGNVDRVIAELDSIKAIPKEKVPEDQKAVSPDGKLMGKTNLHSGLRRAYGLAGKGFIEEVGYVDPEALVEGCDTIFLLSDGAPSWDDFSATDRDYGEGNVVMDTEYGKAAPRTANLVYPGPYVQDEWLIEDVRRMNAFRRIRMHCIGLGEANMGLLKRLAEMGHGESFAFGAGKGEKLGPDEGGAKK